jgi:hypothetical protein
MVNPAIIVKMTACFQRGDSLSFVMSRSSQARSRYAGAPSLCWILVNLSGVRQVARGRFAIETTVHPWQPSPMRHLAQARKVFDIELAALKQARAQLDAEFDRAIGAILPAREAVLGVARAC